MDARIWLISTIFAEPGYPVKYYVSIFPKSRGTFFKAKSNLVGKQIINDSIVKRGYMNLDIDEATLFILVEYPNLIDMFTEIKIADKLHGDALE